MSGCPISTLHSDDSNSSKSLWLTRSYDCFPHHFRLHFSVPAGGWVGWPIMILRKDTQDLFFRFGSDPGSWAEGTVLSKYLNSTTKRYKGLPTCSVPANSLWALETIVDTQIWKRRADVTFGKGEVTTLTGSSNGLFFNRMKFKSLTYPKNPGMSITERITPWILLWGWDWNPKNPIRSEWVWIS